MTLRISSAMRDALRAEGGFLRGAVLPVRVFIFAGPKQTQGFGFRAMLSCRDKRGLIYVSAKG